MEEASVDMSEALNDSTNDSTGLVSDMSETPIDSTNGSTGPAPNEVNGTSNQEVEEEVPMEVAKDEEHVPARLVIAGFDDDNEAILLMTIEECTAFVASKMENFFRDPNTSPLLLLRSQILSLKEKIQSVNEEFNKLMKMYDALYREQIKYLRHLGVIPKAETQIVGVSVDLPWLPETVSGLLRDDLMKKSSENRSVLNSSGTNANDTDTASKPAKKESSGPIECIDLTDDDLANVLASTSISSSSVSTPTVSTTLSTKPSVSTVDLPKSITITPINPNQNSSSTPATKPNLSVSSTSVAKPNDLKHPAPLPAVPPSTDSSDVLPKPELSIATDKNGIVLQWDYPPEIRTKKIVGYEIVGYQEKNNMAPSLTLWKKIGCVSPMPLPMSCTLTQFVEGFRYHFAIRALGKDCKPGHFSNPATIMFSLETKKKIGA